jgi:hypothetical protein
MPRPIATVRAAATVWRIDEATTEMANIPQKSKDATEEALSAIQEALSIRPPETRPATPLGSSPESDLGNPPPAGPDLFPQDGSAAGWPAGDTTPRRAANDDRAGIGQISLRRRSARAPYIAAGIAGLIWVAGGLAISSLYSGQMQAAFAAPGTGLAVMVALAAAITVPVIFFFVLAHAVQPCTGYARGRRIHG